MRYVLDIECYMNYFLMMWIPEDGSAPFIFEKFNDVVTISNIDGIDWSGTFITFNGYGYDFPMWGALWAGFTNEQLKYVSDSIIKKSMMPWIVEREFGINIPSFDHIDIMQVLPDMMSLKIYGGRINSKKLQDLPIQPDAIITDEQRAPMREYCANDCKVTWELLKEVSPQIALRVQMGEQYGLDLRSKSDAQIAEAVINSEYLKRAGKPLYKPTDVPQSYKYTPPEFVEFYSQQMVDVLENIKKADFKIKASNGQVIEPDEMKTIVDMGCKYQMGIGGLHSIDGPGSFYSDDDVTIYDIDVASYYPRIILNAGYYPQHIGPVFSEIYSEIVEKRLAAKKAGDKVTADSLKITINGSFGKLGSKYSKIYAPDLMFHVTVTGQLCLLMLIERFPELVISANTDGIMVAIPKDDLPEIEKIVSDWEIETGFEMEWNAYKSVHRRDVNNYCVIAADGSVKNKGVFKLSNIEKNPANNIIYKAVREYFQHGTPVSQTILDCTDITEFLSLRTVKAGAKWGSEILGKSVRWYHSWLSANCIEYQSNGNKVPLSDASVPLMEMPDTFPRDVNHHWYINEANKLLEKMK